MKGFPLVNVLPGFSFNIQPGQAQALQPLDTRWLILPIFGTRLKILMSTHEYGGAEFWDLAAGSGASARSRQFAPRQGYRSPSVKAQGTLRRACLGHTASGLKKGRRSRRDTSSPQNRVSCTNRKSGEDPPPETEGPLGP